MGQGHYISVVFGVAEAPEDLDGKAMDKALRAAGIGYLDQPSHAYESTQRWIGYPIAADSGMADSGMLVLQYTAMDLDKLREYIETEGAKILTEARAKWERVRALVPTLPEGRLVFVADYD